MPKLEQSAHSPEAAPPSPKLALALLPAPKACSSFGVFLPPFKHLCALRRGRDVSKVLTSEPMSRTFSRWDPR